MYGFNFGYYLIAVVMATVLVVFAQNIVSANISSSANYQVVESEFGSSSSLESCSDQYCARASIGELFSGDSKSPSGQTAAFGSIPPESEPLLEVIIEPGESNLGELTTEQTASKTMIVKIRNYLSEGYTLQITGDPPRYQEHELAAPSSPVSAAPGTEQFAINAVANTSPSIGANPVQEPSGEFSFGEVMPNYNQSNLFKYTSGDVVARSLSESGRTDYTISMIINISAATPAGHFSGDFSAVVIPVF